MNQPPKIVSACLAGEKCRYDGRDNLIPAIREMVMRGEAVMVCPEVAAGLPTPRDPVEIRDGRAVTRDGLDLTQEFTDGAHIMLAAARQVGATQAILKSRSPSCGCGEIYDGNFNGQRVPGDGFAAALLKASGVEVISSDNFQANSTD
jgi:uncharacterized protein YbbK (DUF523 family)